MIVFNKEIAFNFENSEELSAWISNAIIEEGFKEGEINYIFCTDKYLLDYNVKYLKHNTLTDIISFDYTMGKLISGDIFISIDRVIENAQSFNVPFEEELRRVMIHGVLHYCGYKDKTAADKKIMRTKENFYLQKFKK